MKVLRALYDRVNERLRPHLYIDVNELSCISQNGNEYLFHTPIASYVGDIPEGKEILALKRGNHTAWPCMTFETTKKVIQQFLTARRGILLHTMPLDELANRGLKSR